MNQRGIFYVLSLSLVFFLTIASASMLMRGISETGISERSRSQNAAFQLADAGIDQAAVNLQTLDTADDITTASLSTGTYTLDTPSAVGALLYDVRSHGTSGSEQRTIDAVYLLTAQSVFQYALFGDVSVGIGGNALTDSYQSTLGSYASQTPGKHGDVGTNSTTPGGIDVTGTSLVVNGQIKVGPNVADPSSVVTGNVNDDFITGGPPKYVSQPNEFPMPDVGTPPAGCTSTIPPKVGGVITFVAGTTYCLGGTVKINGNDTWTANGNVTIYIQSLLTIEGNATVGNPVHPSYMAFLVQSNAETVFEEKVAGTVDFYGTIYAPDANVSVKGNAEIYGSVIARHVDLTGSAQIHYDEDLKSRTDISNRYHPTLKSWREL